MMTDPYQDGYNQGFLDGVRQHSHSIGSRVGYLLGFARQIANETCETCHTSLEGIKILYPHISTEGESDIMCDIKLLEADISQNEDIENSKIKISSIEARVKAKAWYILTLFRHLFDLLKECQYWWSAGKRERCILSKPWIAEYRVTAESILELIARVLNKAELKYRELSSLIKSQNSNKVIHSTVSLQNSWQGIEQAMDGLDVNEMF